MKGAIAIETNEGINFIVREIINIKMAKTEAKTQELRAEELETAGEEALIFLNNQIVKVKENFDMKIMELRDRQQALSLLLFAVFVLNIVQTFMIYFRM